MGKILTGGGTSKGSQIKVIADGTVLTVADGLTTISIHELFDGMNLSVAQAAVATASSSGLPTIQIHRLRGAVDVLSTPITLDVGELDSVDAATPAVVNATNADVVTGDKYRIDCDLAGTDTAGLEVRFTFSK